MTTTVEIPTKTGGIKSLCTSVRPIHGGITITTTTKYIKVGAQTAVTLAV